MPRSGSCHQHSFVAETTLRDSALGSDRPRLVGTSGNGKGEKTAHAQRHVPDGTTDKIQPPMGCNVRGQHMRNKGRHMAPIPVWPCIVRDPHRAYVWSLPWTICPCRPQCSGLLERKCQSCSPAGSQVGQIEDCGPST